MNNTIDLEAQFAGRLMALDRSALPALSARAARRAACAGFEQLAERHQAAIGGRDSLGTIAVQRVGAVAVVPLTGLITCDPFLGWLLGGTSPDSLASALQQAAADPQVTSIILLVDSPGGEVSLVQETAAIIRQLRASKPITAIARTLMASAAYWLASSASTVVATPSSQIGAVGVYTTHVDQSGLDEKIGLSVTYIASDPKKVEANPDAPLSTDARTFLQSQVDRTYGQFVADLALGRRTSEANVRSGFGQGRIFGADEAVRRGMANRVDTLQGLLLGAQGSDSRSPRPYAAFSAADNDAIAILIALGGVE